MRRLRPELAAVLVVLATVAGCSSGSTRSAHPDASSDATTRDASADAVVSADADAGAGADAGADVDADTTADADANTTPDAAADSSTCPSDCGDTGTGPCCTPDVANNPPIPTGYRLMMQSEVTSEMTTWAVSILQDPTGYPMFSTATMTFGTVTVLLRVEWHPPDFQNNVTHRGVTLYVPL